MFSVLSNIKSDKTFNHKDGLKLFDKEDKFNNYYSIDLSAATDRMPRDLQAEIIKGLFNRFNKDGDSIAKN